MTRVLGRDSARIDLDAEKGSVPQNDMTGANGNTVSIAVTPTAPAPAAPAPAAAAAPMMQVNAINLAPEVYKALVAAGDAKIPFSYFRLAVMGLMAGFYLGFGFAFCCAVSGNLGSNIYGALAFPTGLLLIILCGAELFTGNTTFMITAEIDGKANLWHNIKIMFSAYFWNLCGCLVSVGLQLGGEVWTGREDFVHNFAQKKMALSWGACVCRAILANWLVNLAVYQSLAARDVIGKAIAVWTPISCFVSIGLEHCIANMWVIPMSIYLAPTEKWPNTITWADFIAKNLIPATIGNWIGGAICVGVFKAAVYGATIPAAKDRMWDSTLGKMFPKLP